MYDAKPWRSLLFMPANNWKMLNKAAAEREDGVLIDLEDACPVADRETGRVFARDIAPVLKERAVDVLVRINSMQSGVAEDDLDIVVTDALDGVMLPKSETADDVISLDELLTKREKEVGLAKKKIILPLIESPKGVVHAYEIASASNRVVALGFGAGDFMREMGEGFAVTQLTADEYFPYVAYARSAISVAAAARGIAAIDTPFFGLLIDLEGLEREARKAKLMGFKGKMLTHPRHIDVVNRVFSPSDEEVAVGRRVLDAYEQSTAAGKGAVVLDGRMIDNAMLRMATDVIARAETIAEREKTRVGTDPAQGGAQ